MKVLKTANFKRLANRSEEEVIAELLDTWKSNYLQEREIFQYDDEEGNEARAKAFGEGWIDPSRYDGTYGVEVQEYFSNSDNSALDNAAREIGMDYNELAQIAMKRIHWK